MPRGGQGECACGLIPLVPGSPSPPPLNAATKAPCVSLGYPQREYRRISLGPRGGGLQALPREAPPKPSRSTPPLIAKHPRGNAAQRRVVRRGRDAPLVPQGPRGGGLQPPPLWPLNPLTPPLKAAQKRVVCLKLICASFLDPVEAAFESRDASSPQRPMTKRRNAAACTKAPFPAACEGEVLGLGDSRRASAEAIFRGRGVAGDTNALQERRRIATASARQPSPPLTCTAHAAPLRAPFGCTLGVRGRGDSPSASPQDATRGRGD